MNMSFYDGFQLIYDEIRMSYISRFVVLCTELPCPQHNLCSPIAAFHYRKRGTFLGVFIFLSTEKYNCDIFLSTGTNEYIINR
jgi:hypothetical protein